MNTPSSSYPSLALGGVLPPSFTFGVNSPLLHALWATNLLVSCTFQPPSLSWGEVLVKSLTCNNLDLYSVDPVLLASVVEGASPSPPPQLESNNSAPLQAPEVPTLVPSCAPWLFTGLMLMGLNTYFPQLSLVYSLWSPLIEDVP
ncbi:hypothetical protein DSO57_1031243 [Entomophthora muscae]|uniref:Uncharacterized protein n=1 Tax=Entomophthora muscae TaxID=34485 RepID=A0ACC2T0K7_9FUNG|nr:hypothetical protein DSO57_1031243 [Entomophthora muscae]